MKKDRVSNPLRRKCSRLELNIRRLNPGARIPLGVGRNHGSGAEKDTSRGQCKWERVLHDRGSSLLSTVCQSKNEKRGRTFLVQ
jgi:hypothetical protein